MKNISIGVLFVFFLLSKTVAQRHYRHNVTWGRLVLSDTVHAKLKWELYIQHRRQNTEQTNFDVFNEPQFTSYWAWLHYTLSPTTKLSVSPFGYFKSWLLIAQPADSQKQGIKELRWSARIDQEQKLKWFTLANRYGLEYRWRDLANNGVYLPNWRIRYMLRFEKPLKIGRLKNPVSLVVNDEIFIQFGRAVRTNPNIFDQNRIYAGFNYGITKNIKFSLGYIYGIQERNSGDEFDFSNILWGVLTFDNLFSQWKKRT